MHARKHQIQTQSKIRDNKTKKYYRHVKREYRLKIKALHNAENLVSSKKFVQKFTTSVLNHVEQTW